MNKEHLYPFLEVIIPAVRRAERFLGPYDDWIEDDRRILYEAANGLLTWLLDRPTICEKAKRDYATTANVDPDTVEEVLHTAGYQRNLLSTRKYRTHHGGGTQWAVGSWVYDPVDTDWQHHVFLFPANDSGTDIYGHRETSVRDPEGHLTDEQTPGDPNNRVSVLLDEHDITYENTI